MAALDISPAELAGVVDIAGRPLIGLDVDGVLSPIVERAHEAALLPGVGEALCRIARCAPVAVVSGRSLTDLDSLFGFPDEVEVIGSHGLERRGAVPLQLDPVEEARLDRLRELATEASRNAGSGAWVEHKPASVVLHVRGAALDRAAEAVDQLVAVAATLDGAHLKPGHAVVELMVRSTSKANAVEALRRELAVSRVVFAGDDRTDEEVFASLGEGDCSIRVGPGDTAAAHRLADPDAVLAFVRELTAQLGQNSTC